MSFQKYKMIISLFNIFDPEANSNIIPPDSKRLHLILMKYSKDESIGEVLYFSRDLRDGPVLVYVDDDGHTNIIASNEDAVIFFGDLKNIYLGTLTEEHEAVNKIYNEFHDDFFAAYFEIYNLRKQLADLTSKEDS